MGDMPTGRGLPQPETDLDRMRCVVDGAGNLVFASPAVGWSVGFRGDTLIGKPAGSILKIVSSRDSKHQALSFAALQSGFYEVALLRRERDPLLVQARIDRVDAPDGRKFIVLWLDLDNKLKRQRNNDFHKEARDFTSFVVDTQAKAHVEETQLATAATPEYISNADGELRHFLNLTSDLMGVYRRDGSFGRVNATFNRALGYTDAELKSFPFIQLIMPEDQDMVRAAMQRINQAPQNQEARADFEARTRCRDGAVRWIRWAYKTSGEYVYIVGQDITNIKQHEVELQRREEQCAASSARSCARKITKYSSACAALKRRMCATSTAKAAARSTRRRAKLKRCSASCRTSPSARCTSARSMKRKIPLNPPMLPRHASSPT